MGSLFVPGVESEGGNTMGRSSKLKDLTEPSNTDEQAFCNIWPLCIIFLSVKVQFFQSGDGSSSCMVLSILSPGMKNKRSTIQHFEESA